MQTRSDAMKSEKSAEEDLARRALERMLRNAMKSEKSAEEEHTTNNLSQVVENVEKIARDVSLIRWRVGMIMALQILGIMFVVLAAILEAWEW